MHRTLSLILLLITLHAAAAHSFAAEPRKVSLFDHLPFGQKPIDYWVGEPQDPVSRLQRRIDDEKLDFAFDEKFGYLPAVLKELEVPVESQLLRFSSGSLQRFNVKPERPRAVYFNDDVSVAWFPDADQLEIISHDGLKGVLFFTLTNKADALPRFHRGVSQVCLACHQNIDTRVSVPGHAIPVVPDIVSDEGAQSRKLLFSAVMSHVVLLEKRWSSEYVTGISAQQQHRGNLTTMEEWERLNDNPTYFRHLADLGTEFDTGRYPTNTSDVVAHLVFDHQMLGVNLLARYSYEHQLNVRSKQIEPWLLRYLLLADEAPLSNPVAGTSAYAEWYRQRGPQDPVGRSLYELDLQSRVFRHRISPLIQCRMVQGFPADLRQRLYGQLNAILAGREELKDYHVPEPDRLETLALLRATIPDWPKE